MAITEHDSAASDAPQQAKKKDRTHWLYISVIAAVVLGAIIGLVAPDLGKALKPLGDGFVALIKMIIAPVIFCTIVLGIGSIAKAATVGKVGGLALLYFIGMSTFALALGLVVMGLWALRPASLDYFAGRSLNRDTPVLVPEQ